MNIKHSVSNIALDAYEHVKQLPFLKEAGLTGLEVAPSRVWRETWKGLTNAEVQNYRKHVEGAGLQVVGLHSLFYDHPELGLFQEKETRDRTLDYMNHLSKICRDLGGKTLVYGGGRKRGDLNLEAAFAEAEAFFQELIPRIEDHGTILCFEPLGPSDTDFINSVYDSLRLVKAVEHPALKVQLDAKALVANDEFNKQIFEDAAPYLVHVHANEPDLGVLGASGTVDHKAMAGYLSAIEYHDFVSIEQKMIGPSDPLSALSKSIKTLKRCYQ